ncbi:transposase [Pseudomonas fluvialis]|uniref:Transposase n=1 Tax=Pseudomonas fluvialis TaxID=1793966 RepID=A0A2I0CMM5_9PSED|nr:AAA family ATPase [Pseudomonas pharmacofabricae]PKF70416.1 transposase [Pseudomonas pharmacofabricae]
MKRLKQVLASVGKGQADLARAVKLSPAAIAQLINHGQWPKSIPMNQLAWAITEYLMQQGAEFDAVRAAFDEMGPARANAQTPATPETNHENQECPDMLMAKQTPRPDTKRVFGLMSDPFGDLRSAEDMYFSGDIRYIRESMYQTARFDGFLAVVGESGAGKSTLRRDLSHRLRNEPVITIDPFVIGMEASEVKGKTLKATHIAEAIMYAVAPLETPKSSPEARFRQVHTTLKNSFAAGNRHVLIIEEAHAIPVPTLNHLKRMRDQFEDGFDKLLSIILIGQPELLKKLSPRNADVREVAQRVEIAILQPIPKGDVEQHLAFRVARANKKLDELIDASGIHAIIERLGSSGKYGASQLYPLAIGNLFNAALNLAAEIGESRVTADVVKGV